MLQNTDRLTDSFSGGAENVFDDVPLNIIISESDFLCFYISFCSLNSTKLRLKNSIKTQLTEPTADEPIARSFKRKENAQKYVGYLSFL